MGLIAGSEDGRLLADDSVTREQFAAIITRYVQAAKFPERENTGTSLADFQDYRAVSPWAEEGMDFAVKNGLFTGKDTGALDPKGTATRGESAVILQRLVRWTVDF